MPLAKAIMRHPARASALLCLIVASATIAGAWTLQAMGYIPCELCLLGRIPYYVAILIAAATLALSWRGPAQLARVGLALLAAAFLVGAAIAVYHAGVELKFWAGPTECSGALTKTLSAEDFMAALKHVKPVRCDEPALVIFGLSLAAWSAVVCFGLAGVAALGWRASAKADVA